MSRGAEELNQEHTLLLGDKVEYWSSLTVVHMQGAWPGACVTLSHARPPVQGAVLSLQCLLFTLQCALECACIKQTKMYLYIYYFSAPLYAGQSLDVIENAQQLPIPFSSKGHFQCLRVCWILNKHVGYKTFWAQRALNESSLCLFSPSYQEL